MHLSFENNLGRPALLDMPGWYRSFTLSFQLAKRLECNRILHIESDAFVLSERLVRFLVTTDGWTALWARSKNVPETGIQVIAPDAMELFERTVSLPYDSYRGRVLELKLPFTRVDKNFIGDRYGETRTFVPWQADWTMQTHQLGYTSVLSNYFWFLDPRRKGDLNYRPDLRARWVEHGGSFITATGDVAWCVPFEGASRWFQASADTRVATPALVIESIARMSADSADANSIPGRKHVDVSLPKTGSIRIPAIRIWKAAVKSQLPGETLALVEIDKIHKWHVRYNSSGTMTY